MRRTILVNFEMLADRVSAEIAEMEITPEEYRAGIRIVLGVLSHDLATSLASKDDDEEA